MATDVRVRTPQRAIFIDVENTSSEETLMEVIESLKIDRAAQATELTAVGNWRAIGQRMARQLAGLGAQLVHSAPALGVRDWSDLWIAVAAGCWLGQSAPGDILEIVSNDRAFDAVGDAAAARGVIYRRMIHRRAGAASAQPAAEAKPASSRRSRGGRRRRRPHDRERPAAVTAGGDAAATHPAAVRHVHPPAHVTMEAQGATREQMLAVIGRLMAGDPGKWVNLDVLEKALKAEGFARPPGSPRLVTRLRAIKDVELDSHGRVRLVSGIAPDSTPPPADRDQAQAPRQSGERQQVSEAPATDADAAPPKRRRRRRPAKAKPSASRAAAEPPSPPE